MTCPYCGSHNWGFSGVEGEGELIQLTDNYAVIRFEADCVDCKKDFHCDVRYGLINTYDYRFTKD